MDEGLRFTRTGIPVLSVVHQSDVTKSGPTSSRRVRPFLTVADWVRLSFLLRVSEHKSALTGILGTPLLCRVCVCTQRALCEARLPRNGHTELRGKKASNRDGCSISRPMDDHTLKSCFDHT